MKEVSSIHNILSIKNIIERAKNQVTSMTKIVVKKIY